MKPTHAFGSVALLFVVAIGSTVSGMKVSQRADYVDTLTRQIANDESRIQVLRTELAYLSSPQRVQALVDLHRPDLGTPDSQQYVLNVHDVLPQDMQSNQIMPAVVKNESRAQANRLIAISLPAPIVQTPAAEPHHEADSIAQIITDTQTPATPREQPRGLSSDFLATVQNVAARDVTGQ
jgi:hypothetical protein